MRYRVLIRTKLIGGKNVPLPGQNVLTTKLDRYRIYRYRIGNKTCCISYKTYGRSLVGYKTNSLQNIGTIASNLIVDKMYRYGSHKFCTIFLQTIFFMLLVFAICSNILCSNMFCLLVPTFRY